MRFRNAWAFFLLLVLTDASPALGADGRQEGGSLLVWVMLMLPVAVILVFVYWSMGGARKQQGLVVTEMERTEEERQRTATHRENLEAQVDRLDEKLTRVIELLTAIEQGQRTGRL
jgi:hypothetical protein